MNAKVQIENASGKVTEVLQSSVHIWQARGWWVRTGAGGSPAAVLGEGAAADAPAPALTEQSRPGPARATRQARAEAAPIPEAGPAQQGDVRGSGESQVEAEQAEADKE